MTDRIHWRVDHKVYANVHMQVVQGASLDRQDKEEANITSRTHRNSHHSNVGGQRAWPHHSQHNRQYQLHTRSEGQQLMQHSLGLLMRTVVRISLQHQLCVAIQLRN